MIVFEKEYELRKMARSESRRYCDPYALTYQAERMPEQIRMKVIESFASFKVASLIIQIKVFLFT